MSTIFAGRSQRREVVRRHTTFNGFDYLEVGTNRRILTVHFLGKAPVSLEPANVVIEGGQRIRDLRVESVTIHRSELAELDDTMEVVTDREGDFSTYRLRVVTRDEHGHVRRHPVVRSELRPVDFTFKVDCPSDLDCKHERACPPEPRTEPVDQLSGQGLRELPAADARSPGADHAGVAASATCPTSASRSSRCWPMWAIT